MFNARNRPCLILSPLLLGFFSKIINYGFSKWAFSKSSYPNHEYLNFVFEDFANELLDCEIFRVVITLQKYLIEYKISAGSHLHCTERQLL